MWQTGKVQSGKSKKESKKIRKEINNQGNQRMAYQKIRISISFSKVSCHHHAVPHSAQLKIGMKNDDIVTLRYVVSCLILLLLFVIA